MRKFKKLSLTLALLLTAVGGAWAQDADYIIHVDFDHSYNPDETRFICDIMKMPSGEVKGTLDLSVDGDLKGSFPVNGEMFMGNIDPVDAGDHTWSAEFKPEGGGSFKGNGSFRIKKAYTSIYYNGPTSINLGVGESTELDVYIFPGEAGELSYSSSDASVASITKELSYKYIIEAKAVGTATITFSCAGSTNYEKAEDVKITVTVSTPPIKVTTDAAEEGATFTEASFLMPTYDVNVNYELVRDMSVKVSAEVGDDGNDGYRIRIKKDGDDYVPVDDKGMLVSVYDDLNDQDLTVNTDFTLVAQKKGEGDSWTDLSIEDKLSVGTFRYKVTGVGKYDGTIYSNEFVLFEGYQVVIPAGEYVTYYKDEAVRLEEKDKNDIELCTITAVEDGKAVLSDNFDAMKANKPFLLKNTTNEEKTILLIPCNEPNLAVTVAKEFKGTEGPRPFSEAEMADGDYYVCNGKEFIKVRGEGTLAPNKAFLFVEGNNTPASIPFRRSIGGEGEGTTGVDNVNANLNDNEATWYDLNGRKLNGKPAQKGIYIKNGKKIVVK